MFPAQALAEVMLRRGWRVKLSTDARGARYTGGFPHSPPRSRGLERHLRARRCAGQGYGAVRVMGRCGRHGNGMLRDRPDVVMGFGGYPVDPGAWRAWLLRGRG